MRFSTVLVSFVAAAGFVAAQSSSTSSTVPVPTTSYDKVTAACLGGCKEDDVNCRAACFGNPHPDEAAVNATTQCAMKCEQGKGSEEETKKYADCQQACIHSLFLTTTGGVPKATAGSSSTSSDGSKPTEGADSTEKDGEAKESDKTSDKPSGAGKLAVSAGGAIALAFVALAL